MCYRASYHESMIQYLIGSTKITDNITTDNLTNENIYELNQRYRANVILSMTQNVIASILGIITACVKEIQ